MNSSTLKRIAIAAAALAVIGFGLSALDRPNRTEASDGDRLFPKLYKRLNDVKRVTVRTTDGTSTLVRDGDSWGLEERNGYPVQLSTLRALLLEMAQSETLDAKTSNPDLYDRLGVQDVGTGTTPNHEIRIFKGKKKEMAALIVGERRQGRGAVSHYVREPDEQESWLVKAKLSVPGKPSGWLVSTIAEIDPERVQTVRLRHADGEELTITRESRDDANLELVTLPEGKQLKYAHITNSLRDALRKFNLQDVLSATEIETPTEPLVRATFWTFGGLEVEIDLWTVESEVEGEENPDEITYVVMRAAEQLSPHGMSAAPEENTEAEAAEAPSTDVATEMTQLNSRTHGWVYEISSYAKGNLVKRLDDLIKDAPEPEIEEEPAEEVAEEPAAKEDAAISNFDFEQGTASGEKFETHGLEEADEAPEVEEEETEEEAAEEGEAAEGAEIPLEEPALEPAPQDDAAVSKLDLEQTDEAPEVEESAEHE